MAIVAGLVVNLKKNNIFQVIVGICNNIILYPTIVIHAYAIFFFDQNKLNLS